MSRVLLLPPLPWIAWVVNLCSRPGSPGPGQDTRTGGQLGAARRHRSVPQTQRFGLVKTQEKVSGDAQSRVARAIWGDC